MFIRLVFWPSPIFAMSGNFSWMSGWFYRDFASPFIHGAGIVYEAQ
jgi:hypothetical protein